jgi:hypothetical protein
MAAPAGNQFWKLRSKHGRDKLFETPELLWEAACEYFEWCEANPLIEIDFKIVDGELTEVKFPKMRPFTLNGLCLYLDCGTAYFRNFKNEERAKADGFKSVIAKIEETIYEQKFSGAAAGFLKENIIARDLGLADKNDGSLNVKLEQITGMKFKDVT